MAHEMTVVFDVDDVLCDNNGRDYENAIPMIENIAKVNALHKKGYKIALYTSRGMFSCGGDAARADAKNRDTLERWLEDHGVMYDELTFGKPLGVMYVDDKCMTPDDLNTRQWYEMQGGSGAAVRRMGRFVQKDLGDSLDAFKDWEQDREMVPRMLAPRVISYTYDTVVMDYVGDGDLAHVRVLGDDWERIEFILGEERDVKMEGFDMLRHIEILRANEGYDQRIDEMISDLVPRLLAISDRMKEEASFCHGDMTFSNVLMKRKTDKRYKAGLYFIDPRYDREASSWLLDVAKLKMSLDGYEERLGLAPALDVSPSVRSDFKRFVKFNRIEHVVQVLELMYVLRLTRYRYGLDLERVVWFAEDVQHDLKVMLRSA